MRSRIGSLAHLALLAGFLTGLTGLVAESVGGQRPAHAREDQADDQARRELLALGFQPPAEGLAVVNGVELLHAHHGFELPLGHGMVSGGPAPPAHGERAERVVREELARLPAAFLASASLRRVVLVGELREERRPIPSLPNYNRTLLLDADASEAYLRRLLHHEIFHFADLADDGAVLRDPEWSALNPPGFAYGQGGRSMREPGAGALGEPPPGFVSVYATAAVEEDKAEVFAWMMAAPELLAERARHDPIVRAKRARVGAIITALAPEMAPLLAP